MIWCNKSKIITINGFLMSINIGIHVLFIVVASTELKIGHSEGFIEKSACKIQDGCHSTRAAYTECLHIQNNIYHRGLELCQVSFLYDKMQNQSHIYLTKCKIITLTPSYLVFMCIIYLGV